MQLNTSSRLEKHPLFPVSWNLDGGCQKQKDGWRNRHVSVLGLYLLDLRRSGFPDAFALTDQNEGRKD